MRIGRGGKCAYFQFLLLLWGLWTPDLPAGTPIVVRDQFTQNVALAFEYLRDPSDSMTLTNAQSAQFQALTSLHPNFSYSTDTFWLRGTIRRESKEPVVFHIDYPLLDKIEVFAIADGRIIFQTEIGDQDQSSDQGAAGVFVLPTEPLQYDLYLRIKSTSTLHIPLEIHSLKAFGQREKEKAALTFGIAAVLFAMAAFHLFVFVQTGSRSYLYYVLFTSGLFLFEIVRSGEAQQVLWSEAFNNYLLPRLLFLIEASGMLFTLRFLGHTKRFLGLRKLMVKIPLVAALVFVGSHAFNYGVNIRAAAVLGVLVIVLMLTYAILLAFWAQDRTARFYLLAWSFYLAGAFIYVSTQFNVLPLNLFTQNAMALGAVAEVILLAVALGDRYQQLQIKNHEIEMHRTQLQVELRQELQSRVTLVSELAHRMNNPLNYVITGLNAGRAVWQKLFTETRALFEGAIEEDDTEGQTLKRNFMRQFEEMERWLYIIEQGAQKSSASITEIRSLSGVDGYDLQKIDLSKLWEKVWERFATDVGVDRCSLICVTEPLQEHCYLLGNRFALIVAFDGLLKEWSRQNPQGMELSFFWREEGGLPRLTLQVHAPLSQHADSLQPETLKHLQFIVKPYGIELVVLDAGRLEVVNRHAEPLPGKSLASGQAKAA